MTPQEQAARQAGDAVPVLTAELRSGMLQSRETGLSIPVTNPHKWPSSIFALTDGVRGCPIHSLTHLLTSFPAEPELHLLQQEV